MNTQSPLTPLGRVPENGKPVTKVVVITIVALHVVFFTGLLFQGCRRPTTETAHTPDLGLATPPTNPPPADTFAGYTPPYTPPTTGTTTPTSPAATGAVTHVDTGTNLPATLPTNLWTGVAMQPTNLVTTPEPAPEPAPAGVTEHTIAPGDTPAKIARKYGISLEQLREANPSMDDRRLRIGQKLQIPVPARKEVAAATAQPGVASAPPAAGAAEAGATVHVVKSGETLTRIAARYGTTVKELRQYNNLRTDRILVNQKLKIPPTRTATPATTTSAAVAAPPANGPTN